MGEKSPDKFRYEDPDWDEMLGGLADSEVVIHPGPPDPVGWSVGGRFTDTRPLARWLIGALILGMVTRGVRLGTSWVMRSWFAGEARPLDGSFGTIDSLSIGSGIATIVITLVTGVLWIVWLWYAYSNLPGLARRPLYKRFWVWLGWFVPIWSLFRPKELHNEVWRSGGDERVPGWFHLWWLLFLVGLVTDRLTSATEFTWADVFANAVGILVSVLAVAVIWRSAVRQWNGRNSEDGRVQTVGRLSRFGPAAVGVASIGLAAMLVMAPHSQNLPRGSRVAGLLDIESGECFTGSDSQELGLIWVVDCSAPHDGESVGAVEIDAASYPGLNSLSDFGTIGCWSAFYEYAGDTADNLDFELHWYSPLRESWNQGYSSVVCLVSHVEREPLSSSLADADSPWIALEHLREETCYELHRTLLAATEVPCSSGGLKLNVLEIYDNDPLEVYPGEDNLNQALSCSSVGVPIVPTSETWPLGDRVSVCFTTQQGSA